MQEAIDRAKDNSNQRYLDLEKQKLAAINRNQVLLENATNDAQMTILTQMVEKPAQKKLLNKNIRTKWMTHDTKLMSDRS